MWKWRGIHRYTCNSYQKGLTSLKYRRLFERVASMKFSSKKMKFIFKKWLQFEKNNGTEDDVQKVKERTLAYVESMS